MKSVRIDTAVVCPKCQGSGGEPGSKLVTCSTYRDQGEATTVQRGFIGDIRTAQQYPACQGFGTIIPNPCRECFGEGRVRSSCGISARVPAGVSMGNQIRLEGRGEVGRGSGPAGDLYAELVVAEHERFRRNGNNFEAVMTLPVTAAALDTSIELAILEAEWEGSEEADRKVIVDMPVGTQSGAQTLLKGRGVLRLRGGDRGDLGITIVVEALWKLDEKQRDLLRQLVELRDEITVEAKRPGHKDVRG